jgi:hypothetical protein
MGIYISDVVYGVRIDQKNSDPNKEFIILYEKYNDDKIEFTKSTNADFISCPKRELTKEEKLESLSFYESLEDKSKIRFFIYTECSTTYDIDDKPFMTWTRVDKDEFYDLFQK